MSILYQIAGVPFRSRLWACTAQNFRSGARSLPPAVAEEVIRASGTDIFITYIPSVRELRAMGGDMCAVEGLDSSSRRHLVQLVCTNLSATADEAVEKAVRGIEATGARLIKLEVLDRFLPVDRDTVTATRRLMARGYPNVIPFVSSDPAVGDEMFALGVPALRVLASEIGSGRGIDFPDRIRQICERSPVPVVVEGGIGEPAHALAAIRLGATAVLVNSALLNSADPVRTAEAFKNVLLQSERREVPALTGAR
jgi:thiazole synthase